MTYLIRRRTVLIPALAALVVAVLPEIAAAQGATPPPTNAGDGMPSLWNLAIQGGWFMIPIGIASVVTAIFTFERLNGLRRTRILPPVLIEKLRELMRSPTVNPVKLWEACAGDGSPLANVARAAVLKAGRPQPEVEAAVTDSVRRETREMTRNLRPINVVASIAPLLGLLGTVQGMIMAFMVTSTTSSTGSAKAQELAHGIYTALVTTFAGLCVAVVSVVLANFLEGRVERMLKQMEDIFIDLLPRLEDHEGRLRVAQPVDPADDGIHVRTIGAKGPSRGSKRPAATADAPRREAAEKQESDSPAKPQASGTESTSKSKKPGSRKLGAPRRVRRKAPETTEEKPIPTSVPDDATSNPLLPDEAEALETLRANFDR